MKISKLSRVYIERLPDIGESITIEGDNFHYLKTVIRVKKGFKLRVFNSSDGEFLAQVGDISRDFITIKIVEKLRESKQLQKLILGLCIIKPDRMAEAIRSAVQIGVTEIVPIIAERSQYSTVQRDKLIRSIVQSAEQSERFCIPKFAPEMGLQEFMEYSREDGVLFACEDECEDNNLKNIKDMQQISAALIGPEGGFTDAEIEQAKTYNNVVSVSLGEMVLRSEVAAISLLSYIKFSR